MGKVVVSEFVTLDGVMEDPGGAEGSDRGGWAMQFDGGTSMEFKSEELKASDAQLLGRRTYDAFAEAWPNMEGTGEFGEKMNGMPKYVYSTTLTDPKWNNTIVLGGDLPTEVGRLKERYEGDILVAGSAQLVQCLLAEDLVDEIRLVVYPVVLGGGKRLFADDATRRTFAVSEATQTGSIAILTLSRASD